MSGESQDLIDELDAVIDKLMNSGFPAEASELRSMTHETAWTSSSEMLGEIGLWILGIQRSLAGELPAEVKKGLARCLKFVRKTWPDIELPPA
jgi:hypothetical protein